MEEGDERELEQLLCYWLDPVDGCAGQGIAGLVAMGDGLVMGHYGPGGPGWSADVGGFHGRFVSTVSQERGQLRGRWIAHPDGGGAYVQGESFGPYDSLDGTLMGECVQTSQDESTLAWSWALPEAQQVRAIQGVSRATPGTNAGRFLAIYGAHGEDEPTIHKLSIRNEIDGRSSMEIGAYDATYLHHDYAAPGMHIYFGQDDPSSQPPRATWVQGFEWYPVWPEDGENRDCGCSSSTLHSLPPHEVLVPYAEADITMEVIEGRGEVTIVEEPSAANDYRLTIEWDDNPQGGPSWYEVELTFVTY